jgi:mitogen-activated protein kinase kinase kinase
MTALHRFHIGVAKEHPPLPDSSQLSPEGIQFIKSCLTIDASNRPTAEELLYQPWLENFA